MTQRGYGDSATQGGPDSGGQGGLDKAVEDSASVQGSDRDADQGAAYKAGSPRGGSAAGRAMTSGGTGGYGGGGFDQADPPESGQVREEGRSFEQADGSTPQRGANEDDDSLLGPKGDPAEGRRDGGATARGPLDTGPA